MSKLTVILIVGFGLSSFCLLEVSSQRKTRIVRKPVRVARNGGKSYNNFVHNIEGHRQSCNSCHKSPDGFSTAATLDGESYKYPNITDYPDHDSCVSCHRQQFFRGSKPAICSICHTKVSPRDSGRFSFPRNNQTSEFSIRFPHNVHQDIIANLENAPLQNRGVESAHFVNAKFISRAYLADDKDEKKTDYNNCTICHAPATAKVYTIVPRRPQIVELESGMVVAAHAEKITAPAGYFKAVPTGHNSCFNCHYSEQQPIRTNCAGCHITQSIPVTKPSNVVERISLKFAHFQLSKEDREAQAKEGGAGVAKEYANRHDLECSTCHVRITQSAELRTLSPDVPIFTCSGCHSAKIKMEVSQREDDLEAKKKTAQYQIKNCAFCHNTYIGSFQIPKSHLDVK